MLEDDPNVNDYSTYAGMYLHFNYILCLFFNIPLFLHVHRFKLQDGQQSANLELSMRPI